jgi:hypothetical protein
MAPSLTVLDLIEFSSNFSSAKVSKPAWIYPELSRFDKAKPKGEVSISQIFRPSAVAIRSGLTNR